MTALGILSPGYPATPGGVTDHTARLLKSWSAAGHAVCVAGDRSQSSGAVVDDWAEHDVKGALIQYVPFLYGRRGVSRYPERITAAAQARGIRVAVFVHEPWVPPTRLVWLVTGPMQRVQLRRLVRRASAAATAVPAWQRLLAPQPALIPVGSTLGTPPADLPTDPPLPAPVVFSPFAVGLSWSWILAAAEAIGASPRLTVIGADWETARRHPTIGRLADRGWDWRGRLEPAAALRLLARGHLVLAPFVDGITGRRTSALAAASVGSQVVSSRGHLFDPLFDAGPLLLADSKEAFAGAAHRVWTSPDSPEEQARRRAWYRQHFDPQALDERLLGIVLGSAG